MKCKNCGSEIPESSIFCSFCGMATTASDENVVADENVVVQQNPVIEKILNVFKDKLFIALCILISASTLFSLAAESLPLLLILSTIFLWIIYAKAQKGTVDINNMRNVSGTIYASYVITWVLVGLIAFAVIILIAVISGIGDSINLNTLINEIISEADISVYGFNSFSEIMTGSMAIGFTYILATIFLFACTIAILFNIFAIRSIHKFAKSLYQSAQMGTFHLQKVNAAINWLLVLGILSGISALTNIGNLELFLSSGCTAATHIIAHVLVKKHFKVQPSNQYIL